MATTNSLVLRVVADEKQNPPGKATSKINLLIREFGKNRSFVVTANMAAARPDVDRIGAAGPPLSGPESSLYAQAEALFDAYWQASLACPSTSGAQRV
ncbi:uncharacterized protein AMSG_10628 [Thecamonas trahens ATCC 50062]|uniref:Uncharacterized protein n=1 Tax=Thecamonas trahens ATCC 50062 TaxID=461836 RepID=A0A0L0DU65_THETB|nr:hypothetical protein AMSG_10628 [Thecamonas trahens ATCC 50062]KNC55033.1 hypothetical protein AMSG_10628 [Thecamonas trahens ATCC 50062]|eukprot:XP_013753339.1 hypothetical protein AMSG_10628 [Thecamonas trahens ATCC 50062]